MAACKDDSSWPGASPAQEDNCVKWSELITLRKKYNSARDECAKYGINLTLGSGRPKYGDAPYKEEIEATAGVNGFFSIKVTPSKTVDTGENRFIVMGGSLLNRIPAPNANYTYDHSDFGPWIVYIQDACYGCGGWKLEEGGDYYPRYKVCGPNSSSAGSPTAGSYDYGDIETSDKRSQNFMGRTVDHEICNFAKHWAEPDHYQPMIDHCFALAHPLDTCICGIPAGQLGQLNAACALSKEECCGQYQYKHYTNHQDSGYSGMCPQLWDSVFCSAHYESRQVKWISSHRYSGYVTQVIKAKHINDMWTAIKPAFGGGNRTGADWTYCKSSGQYGDGKWKWKREDPNNADTFTADNIDLVRFQLRDCNRCCRPPDPDKICACHINDLSYVLGKMIGNTCVCDAKTSEASWKGKTMWKIVVGGTPSIEECPCFEACCSTPGSGQPLSDYEYLDNRSETYGTCPNAARPCAVGDTGDCAGATQTKDVESTYEFPDCFMKYKPRASVHGTFDNFGSVGSLQSDNQGTDDCALGYISGHTPVQTFAGSTGKFKMKVTVTSNNATHGGPHGAQVGITFGFEDQIPSCSYNFKSLPNPSDCGGGGGGGGPPNYTGMNFFPVGPGNAMAFV